MILKLLLSIQMIWKMFTKILMNTIWLTQNINIADIIDNKKLNSIVTELFISGRK